MSVSVSSFASLVASFPVVGFSGSRRAPSFSEVAAAGFCGQLARGFEGRVLVGCAAGVDAVVRQVFPFASVFSVSASEASRLGGAAFAARSARLVQSVAESRGVLVAFPRGACPAAVTPSRSFRGCGSGSWGSVALTVGLDCPALVIVEGSSGEFPAPAALASCFSCVGSGVGFSVWWSAPALSPVAGSGVVGSQGSLF